MEREDEKPQIVYVVSVEWNEPPSEVTGDPGIVCVCANEALANEARHAERLSLDSQGHSVYELSNTPGRYCAFCGEPNAVNADGTFAECKAPENFADAEWCDCCGAELNHVDECDNDHDEWDVDVHVTPHELRGVR
jgi:hypothetical protein